MRALFLGAMLAIAVPALAATAEGEVPVGGALREAPLYGLTFDYRKLSDFRGKPLIINVWASWCGPCRAEMGSLDRLARRYNGKQFHIIGISTDDYAEKAVNFVVAAGIAFDNYLDKNLMLENMLGAKSIPLTVLVDAKGRIVKKVYGAREWDSRENLDLIAKTLGVALR
jgi:thiol-disulfide isomerase/thioredoxin